MKFWRNIDGHDVYIERRRYGQTTFTWLYVKRAEADYVCLGDPWPCITPARAEVVEAIKLHVPNQERV